MKKSLTLIELLIAMTFFSVLILGTTAFYLASNRFVNSGERRAQVLNEASLVLEHITDNGIIGISNGGKVGSAAPMPAFYSVATPYGENMLSIVQDGDGTPDNGGEIIIGYAQTIDAGCPNTIFMCNDTSVDHRAGTACAEPAGHEILTRRAVVNGVAGSNVNGLGINNITPNTATVTVTLRFDPTIAEDARTNPQVSLTTTILIPSQAAN